MLLTLRIPDDCAVSLHMLCSLCLSSVSQPPTPDFLFFAASTYQLHHSFCPPPSLSSSFRSHSPHFIALVTWFFLLPDEQLSHRSFKKPNSSVSSLFPPLSVGPAGTKAVSLSPFLAFTLHYLPANKRAHTRLKFHGSPPKTWRCSYITKPQIPRVPLFKGQPQSSGVWDNMVIVVKDEVGVFLCVCLGFYSEVRALPDPDSCELSWPSKSFPSVVPLTSLFLFCPCFISSTQSSEVLGTQLAALESEKAELVQSLSKVEAELAARGEELERVQSSLVTERESRVKSAETLQNQLNEKVMNSNISTCKRLNFSHFKSSTWETRAARSVQIAMFVSLTMCVCPQESREQALESQLAAARWASLQGAVEEAKKIIQDSLAQIDDPAHISCTSSAGQSLTCGFCAVQLW